MKAGRAGVPLEPDSGARASSPVPGEDIGVWRSRRYLPHFEQAHAIQAVTFRLADALPAWKVAELRETLRGSDASRWRQELNAYMDAGHGSCLLKDPRVADIAEKALLYFDGVRYRLIAWVIMPNHVHVVVEILPGFPMSAVLQTWKSFTARKANAILGRSGVFWQAEYFDRLVRNERHLRNAIEYVHANPVKAGLVQEPRAWPFSSGIRWEQAPGTGEDARAPRPGTPAAPVLDKVDDTGVLPAGTAKSPSGAVKT